jgi:hypothetical protein
MFWCNMDTFAEILFVSMSIAQDFLFYETFWIAHLQEMKLV